MEPKKFKYSMIVVPIAVTNGIVSGIVSVITAYFFKPIWNRITELMNNERKTN
jgi:hypothetical protein